VRKRADGSLTYTTEEWDAKWYWPAGTRVRVTALGATGTITKQNAVTATVKMDDGTLRLRVPFSGMERL
jgi:hypothetical protein